MHRFPVEWQQFHHILTACQQHPLCRRHQLSQMNSLHQIYRASQHTSQRCQPCQTYPSTEIEKNGSH